MSDLDPRTARALLDDTEHQVHGALNPRTHLLFGAWGAAWLVGYLAIWASTLGEDPYRSPDAWAFVVLGVALVAATAVTAVVIGRAAAGISGPSSRTGTFFGLTWAVAFVSWGLVIGAVQDSGIPPEAGGLLGAVMPAVLVGVIYCASAAALEVPVMFYVGVALAVVAVIGVWTGPSVAPLVVGVGGALAFVSGMLADRRTAATT